MKFNKYIDAYIELVDTKAVKTSKDIKLAIKIIKKKLSQKNVIIDHEQIEVAITKIEEYFPFKLIPWQKFIIGLVHCFYDDGTLVYDKFLILMGRGGGKNGFISALSWYFTTHFHGIKGYNVDIVANSEKQAKTSFEDVYEVIDDNKKLKKVFHYTKEIITYIKTKSYIKFNTSNAKTKDGLRPACLVFDEIHEYETYDNIKVFTSALGKKKHSRTFFISTNGNVRGGVLDDYLELAAKILNGENTTSRMLPLLFRLDDEKEVHIEEMWEKANPSLRYFPDLKLVMQQEYLDMESQPQLALEFMVKRMNLTAQDSYTVVAEWDKILATNQPIPELKGASCLGSVDFSSVRDFTSVGLLFKYGDKRVFIHHTFICHKALKLENRKIKFDIDLAVRMGLATIINKDTVDPNIVAQWFLDKAKTYKILDILADDFRATVLREAFKKVGLPLHIIRSGYITHNKIYTFVEKLFADENVIFGDDPMMRWYTNNVYVEADKKDNKSFNKIEPKLRKTDGFFAFIHALTKDDELPQAIVKKLKTRCVSY